MEIKKQILFLFPIIIIGIGCSGQKNKVVYNLDKNINDTLPIKIINQLHSESKDSINLVIFITQAIKIKNEYSEPVRINFIQYRINHPSRFLSGNSVFTVSPSNYIERAAFDLNQKISEKDSIIFKYATNYYIRVSKKDRAYLMKNAKLSQEMFDKIYSIGMVKDFRDFLQKHIPQDDRGYIVILIDKELKPVGHFEIPIYF